MDKEIRHRGHTNIIFFLGAAFQAYVDDPKLANSEITAKGGQEVANKGQGLLIGKIDRVLEKRNLTLKEWWVAYAERIHKKLIQNRAASHSGLLEEQEAINSMLEMVDDKEESQLVYKAAVILRKVVRLAVERNQEERLNDKKVTVSGCVCQILGIRDIHPPHSPAQASHAHPLTRAKFFNRECAGASYVTWCCHLNHASPIRIHFSVPSAS